MNLSLVVMASIVVGSLILAATVYRISGRAGLRKHCIAYVFSANVGGIISFWLLLFVANRFPKVAIQYVDAMNRVLGHALPKTATGDLLIIGHFVGAIYLGMTARKKVSSCAFSLHDATRRLPVWGSIHVAREAMYLSPNILN